MKAERIAENSGNVTLIYQWGARMNMNVFSIMKTKRSGT
jgi:hypothetical protein